MTGHEYRELMAFVYGEIGSPSYFRDVWAHRDPHAGMKPAGKWPIKRAQAPKLTLVPVAKKVRRD